MKISEKMKVKLEKSKEGTKMLKNWSLKKKVVVGMGVLGAAALGALAYGKSKQEDEVTYEGDFEDDEFDDYEGDEDDQDAEEAENQVETE